MKISVLILVKNEANNIQSVLDSVKEKLDSINKDYQLVIVDGNSSDNTPEKISPFLRDGDVLFSQTKPGYANGLVEGILHCIGDYVLTLDGDCSHSAKYIDNLINCSDDLTIGSRFVNGGGGKFSFRHFLSIVLNTTFRKMLHIPIRDLSSGFRCYKKDALLDAIHDGVFSENFEVLIEIATKLFLKGYKINETPIQYLDRRSGTSKVILRKWWLAYLKALFKLFSLRRSIKSADYDYRANDSLNLVQRYWQRKRRKIINKLANPDSHILDIGCGSSHMVSDFQKITALDIRYDKLLFLKNTVTNNPIFVQGSAFALPFKPSSFDTVISSQMIEHLPEDDRIFLEMKRVLQDNGTLILGTVDYSRIYWNIIERIYKILMPNSYGDEHITHYGKESLIKKIEGYGFKFLDSDEILKSEIILKFKKCA